MQRLQQLMLQAMQTGWEEFCKLFDVVIERLGCSNFVRSHSGHLQRTKGGRLYREQD